MYLVGEKQISRHADEHSHRFYRGVPPGSSNTILLEYLVSLLLEKIYFCKHLHYNISRVLGPEICIFLPWKILKCHHL